MTTITMRPYVDEADLEPIAEMLNLCETVDQLDEGISVEELRDEFDAPSLDKARDLRLWHDADGTLIGFGQMWIPSSAEVADGSLWFRVHPEARGNGLEDQIVEWGAERIAEVGQERGKPAQLRAGARSTNGERIAVLERNGFTIARYFLRMVRPLDEPIPEPQLPEGFKVRHLNGEEEAEAWVESFNLSFIDHYNHHPLPVADRKHWMTESSYAPERDLVVVAPDGIIAAFAMCWINPQENERTGRNEGWVNILGTRRGYRKMGLGRAVLLAGLRRLKADGVDCALLGVDAASPTGATRLYESVGFRQLHTFINYVKDV